MKNYLSILILFLFFAPSSFGQTEARLYHQIGLIDEEPVDTFRKYYDVFYEYDDFGNPTTTISKIYDN